MYYLLIFNYFLKLFNYFNSLPFTRKVCVQAHSRVPFLRKFTFSNSNHGRMSGGVPAHGVLFNLWAAQEIVLGE
jgi:hypothetical protein